MYNWGNKSPTGALQVQRNDFSPQGIHVIRSGNKSTPDLNIEKKRKVNEAVGRKIVSDQLFFFFFSINNKGATKAPTYHNT